MKRLILIVTIAVTALVLVATLLVGRSVIAQRYGGYGPPWGHGMMWGGGPGGPGWGGGSWGGGPPAWAPEAGSWGGYGLSSQIPQDKRDQLRDLGVETQRKWIGQQAAFEDQYAAYQAALDKFPLDRAAATKAWEAMNGLRKQMLEARLDSMTKAQQIMGKDLWTKLHEAAGPPFGGPPFGR